MTINKTSLKSRGWTEKLIREFAPTPDATAVNPYCESAAPEQLYNLERIKALEATESFIAARAGAKLRQKSSTAAVDTKRAALMRYLETVTITVGQYTVEQLLDLAIRHYNLTQTNSPSLNS